MDYNNNPAGNSLGLLPVYRLYANPVYERLVDKLGVANVYILSAGWGLIRADFLTPSYDSPSVRAHAAMMPTSAGARQTDTTTSACCPMRLQTKFCSSAATITFRCSAN